MAAAKKKTFFEAQARERKLIVLPDQGAAVKISTQLFDLQSRDRSWNPFIESFVRANGDYLDSLAIELSFSTSADAIEIGLKANGVVGAVPLKSPDTHKTVGGIIVRPRYGWDTAGFLFSAIGWAGTPELLKFPIVPGSAKEVPPWIIAGPIVRQMEQLMRLSAPKFRDTEEELSSPRGTIDWQQYCTKQLVNARPHFLPCKYSDLKMDEQLRRYVRWTLEKVDHSLAPFVYDAPSAKLLRGRVQSLLAQLFDVKSEVPSYRNLDRLDRLLKRQLQTGEGDLGFEAIKWVLDERGLAGSTDLDGLAWRIKMHELFEMWIEVLVRQWAKTFGGRVTCSRKFDSQSFIRWERTGSDSLGSLIPDVVVETDDDTFIFDAKYKGFLEPSEDLSFNAAIERYKDDHRHDLHQVLAYASMYQTERITVALVYPVKFETWAQMTISEQDVLTGSLEGPGRNIKLCILAVPIESGERGIAPTRSWQCLLDKN
jgi:hypothetical protein